MADQIAGHQQHRRDGGEHQRRLRRGKLPKLLQRIGEAALAGEIHRVGNALRALDRQVRVVDRDDVVKDEQEQKLIQAVGKVAQDHRADHFLPLHPVEQLADQEAENAAQRHGQQRRQRQTADARNAPFQHEQAGNLRRHRADGDREVDAHARDNRDDEREHDEHVARQAAEQLVEHVVGRVAGESHAHRAEHDEHDGHDIVARSVAQSILIHGSHLPTW